MPAARDRATLVDALEAVWRSLAELGAGLGPEDWDRETPCPGWTVRDQYSHIIGTELMLLDRSDPALDVAGDHIRNDIGTFNESSVEKRRSSSGGDVLAEFFAVTRERLDALRAMDDARFAEVGFTPAGKDTYGRFMQIRVFDCWIHEQDIRDAVSRPGHDAGPAVEVTLDELTNSMGYVVGKKAGAVDGQSVRIELTGPAARTIDVRVDGRAAVVDDLVDPTTTITLPAGLWVRLCGGRAQADTTHPDIDVTGDAGLAAAVVEHANYTI